MNLRKYKRAEKSRIWGQKKFRAEFWVSQSRLGRGLIIIHHKILVKTQQEN